MKKKEKSFELKIYELLGVKIFRKIVFGLYKILGFPFTIFMSKEERKKAYNTPNNYNMKKGHGIQDLRDFKKWLLFNTCVHAFALGYCIPIFLKVVSGTASLSTTINNLICIVINCYCIMLQRYNHIRINQVIKRMEPREEAKKKILKDELIKEDSLLCEHTYKVYNKRNKEKNVTFDELVKTASYVELKQFRDYLSQVKKVMEGQQDYYVQQESNAGVLLHNNSTLKLELKPSNQDKISD